MVKNVSDFTENCAWARWEHGDLTAAAVVVVEDW